VLFELYRNASYPRNSLCMRGQFNAQAALSPGTKPSVNTESCVGDIPRHSGHFKKRKIRYTFRKSNTYYPIDQAVA